jgi:hypothetical protein
MQGIEFAPTAEQRALVESAAAFGISFASREAASSRLTQDWGFPARPTYLFACSLFLFAPAIAIRYGPLKVHDCNQRAEHGCSLQYKTDSTLPFRVAQTRDARALGGKASECATRRSLGGADGHCDAFLAVR